MIYISPESGNLFSRNEALKFKFPRRKRQCRFLQGQRKEISHNLHIINSIVYGQSLPWKPILQSCLVNLKNILLLFECIKF